MSDYKVAIELALVSNAEQLLSVMGSSLLGVNAKVKDLEGGLGRLKLAIGGAFALAGAKALADVMDELIRKGAELEQTMYRLSTAGFTPSQSAAVKANAVKLAGQYRNLTEGELVKLTGETTVIYGSPELAIKNLPIVASYVSAVKYRNPQDPEGAAAEAEDAVFKILRSEEMRGLAQNPAEVNLALTATLKGQEAFGDQFDPTTTFQAIKYGRLASRYLSDRFLEGPGLVLAQELGGSNFGNSLNQIDQAFLGGHITKTALEEAERLGLIDASKVKMLGGGRAGREVQYLRRGRDGELHEVTRRLPGGSYGGAGGGGFDLRDALVDRQLLATEPDLWFQKDFGPRIDKAAKGDLSARDQIIRQLIFRTTGQQLAEILAYQTGPGGRIAKDVARLNAALTPDQAVAAAAGNLATSFSDLSTQVDRFKTNLGAPAAQVVGSAARGISPPLNQAATFLGRHPWAAGAADIGIGVGAVGFGVGGTVMLGKAAAPYIKGLLDILKAGGRAPGESPGSGPWGPQWPTITEAAPKGPTIAPRPAAPKITETQPKGPTIIPRQAEPPSGAAPPKLTLPRFAFAGAALGFGLGTAGLLAMRPPSRSESEESAMATDAAIRRFMPEWLADLFPKLDEAYLRSHGLPLPARPHELIHPPIPGAAPPSPAARQAELKLDGDLTRATLGLNGAMKGFATSAVAVTKAAADAAQAVRKLAEAMEGLPGAPGTGPGPGHSPLHPAAPAINIHVHGAKDPHAVAREVAHHVKKVLASLGGPQRGTSAFDPTVLLPQVGTPYSA